MVFTSNEKKSCSNFHVQKTFKLIVFSQKIPGLGHGNAPAEQGRRGAGARGLVRLRGSLSGFEARSARRTLAFRTLSKTRARWGKYSQIWHTATTLARPGAFEIFSNVLRDNGGLTGGKAVQNTPYLLVFKLIEPHFGRANETLAFRISSIPRFHFSSAVSCHTPIE